MIKVPQGAAIMTAHEKEVMVALACRLQETELVLGKSPETTRLLVLVDKLVPGQLKEVEGHVPLPSLLNHYRVDLKARKERWLKRVFRDLLHFPYAQPPEVYDIDIVFSDITPGNISADIWAYSSLSSESILSIVENALGSKYCRKNKLYIVRLNASNG